MEEKGAATTTLTQATTLTAANHLASSLSLPFSSISPFPPLRTTSPHHRKGGTTTSSFLSIHPHTIGTALLCSIVKFSPSLLAGPHREAAIVVCAVFSRHCSLSLYSSLLCLFSFSSAIVKTIISALSSLQLSLLWVS